MTRLPRLSALPQVRVRGAIDPQEIRTRDGGPWDRTSQRELGGSKIFEPWPVVAVTAVVLDLPARGRARARGCRS